MSTPFQTLQRSEDSIVISPQISHHHQEPRQPVSKKPRTSDESSSTHFSRRVNALFFKTRLCQRFRCVGSCPNGPHCSFAHGPGELRNPPPNWQEIVAKERGFVGESKICKRFYRGEVCPYGERCSFAHVEPGVVGNGSGVGMEGGDGNVNGESIVVVGNGQRQGFWKTRMCNKWEANGYCPFGEKCHFAHGNAELMEWRSHMMELDKVNIEATTSFKPPLKPIRNVKHQIQQNKGFLKCDGLQKISRIYADWIDDVPLRAPFCSPPKART